jgi:flagellar biosynthesis/type III secretory pathway protein FliH
LVKRIISKELDEKHSEIVESTINSISKEISGKSLIKIQVSKEDYESTIKKYDDIKEKFVGADNVIIKPDNELKPGDVFIDTEIGSYDSLIKNRIEEAFKIFDEGSGGA